IDRPISNPAGFVLHGEWISLLRERRSLLRRMPFPTRLDVWRAKATGLLAGCDPPDLSECGGENAVHVLQAPDEFALPAMCAMRGQSFLAETSIGQSLSDNESVRVMCV